VSSPGTPGWRYSEERRWTFLAPPPDYPTGPAARPTFSVIIPTYRAAGFVGEAIESILAQSAPAHEIVVCDDGSDDGIASALGRFGDRVTLLERDHGGVGTARNAAVAAASGEFVALLDADDAFLPERLEALGALAAARPDLDVLASDAYFEANGRRLGRFCSANPFPVAEQRQAILRSCFCPWPAIRRSRLQAVGGFDEALATGSDWEVLIRLILAGCAAGLVDEPLYLYRIGTASLTAARIRTLRDRVRFLEQTTRHPGLGPPERRALRRSLATQRRELALAEVEASLRGRRPDARRRALAVAAMRGLSPSARLGALVALAAPSAARRLLDARGRRSRLRKSVSRAS
jgi:GT2 family glycosyltransferase